LPKKENGNCGLVSGLHKLLALQKLGHKTIKSQIIDFPQTDLIPKLYSLTDNEPYAASKSGYKPKYLFYKIVIENTNS
jgi:hypothetical protein